MNEQKTAYPLCWPPAKPVTAPGRRMIKHAFKTSFSNARDNCLKEIKLLGGTETIVSTNVPPRRKDQLAQHVKWGQSIEGDPGVAVYFKRKGKELCFACDCWTHVQDNMHAITLTIAALRGIARWGTGDMMEAAFTGFAALPAPGQSSGEKPWEVLGLTINADSNAVRDAHRALAKKFHPDNPHTGDRQKFDAVQRAFEMMKQNFPPPA